MEGSTGIGSWLHYRYEAIRVNPADCLGKYTCPHSLPRANRRQKLSELVVEAGYVKSRPTDQVTNNCSSFPKGVINTVPSLGSVGGAALSAHPDVDKVAFTGSTLTGRKVMEAAAKSNLKKVRTPVGLN